MRILAILLLLSACATPQTIMKNDKGTYVSCGGGSAGYLAAGAIGYAIQKNNDDKCVEGFVSKGFKKVEVIE